MQHVERRLNDFILSTQTSCFSCSALTKFLRGCRLPDRTPVLQKKEAGADNDPFAVSLAVGPRRRYEDYLSAFELVDPDFALALGSQAWPYLTSFYQGFGPAPKPEVP